MSSRLDDGFTKCPEVDPRHLDCNDGSRVET